MKYFNKFMKENVGVKLAIFRKAIKKSRPEMAEETGVLLKKLEGFEQGKHFPEIDFLHYLTLKYNLNINWLLGGEDEMFIKEQPENTDSAYVKKLQFKDGFPVTQQYVEFFQLMKIPEIENFIFEKLGEIKHQLKE